MGGGEFEMRLNCGFGKKDSRAWFPDANHRGGGVELGNSLGYLFRSEDLVREMMFARTAAGSGNENSFRRTDHHPARCQQQFSSALGLQVCPQLIRPLNQRNI